MGRQLGVPVGVRVGAVFLIDYPGKNREKWDVREKQNPEYVSKAHGFDWSQGKCTILYKIKNNTCAFKLAKQCIC